jgi:long-chain fatty acid transport protein
VQKIIRPLIIALGAALLLAPRPVAAQYGIILPGAGPVNRAMGGVAVATPVEPLGALFWNPAVIGAFDRSQVGFGVEALLPTATLSSSISPGALGGGQPAAGISGFSRSESGAIPIPNFALVHRLEDNPLTFGLGVFTLGGFELNYSGSTTNPLLTAPPPTGVGVGPVYSQYGVLQIVPAVSYRLTDQLIVGVSPILDMAQLTVRPGIIAPPNDASGNGYPTYPAAVGSRYQFGGGFQAGVFWRVDPDWSLGASFKSPQWFEPFRFHSADELGRPETLRFNFNVPLIASVGASYTGLDRAVIGLDLRYINYAGTRGYNQSGFDASGAVKGLGWRDVFVAALGGSYRVTDRLTAQMGYSFNTNPIPSAQTFFNAASPLPMQHIVSAGVSWNATDSLRLSLAYVHAFANSVSGPIYSPTAGPIPGTLVTSTTAVDSVILGVNVLY